METRVVSKHLRIAPRKVRIVLNAIKGKPAFIALTHLRLLNKKAARLVGKVLNSAIASAKEKKLDETRIFVKEVRADGGPSYKRIMTRSMGRADRIVKRTTHITMVLGEKGIVSSNQISPVSEKSETKKQLFGAGRKSKEKTSKAKV